MDSSFKITTNPGTIGEELKERFPGRRFFLLTDRKVARHCLPKIKAFLPAKTVVFQIPDGEKHKNLSTCELVWDFLLKNKADRESVLLILGGGVIGDMGGFCASVFKRGIDFVLIPTTLLAMADASIGGKTGIDFKSGKNQIGTFQNPAFTWTFPEFLKTLPQVELVSGFAEVVKHTLIADREAWNRIRKRDLEDQDWTSLLISSFNTKMAIVEADLLEKNIRQKLNAGHTVGHAVESYFLYKKKPVPHGFAVAAGLIMEAYLSFHEGYMSVNELTQLEEFLFSVFGKLELKVEDGTSIWKWMQQDKKNKKGQVLMALPGPIGECQIGCSITRSKWEKAFGYYLGYD